MFYLEENRSVLDESNVRRRKVKRSKILIISIVAIMIVTMFSACGSKPEEKKDGEAKGGVEGLTDSSVLVLGCDDQFPPMGFDDNGTLVGFDIDLAREVAKRLGVDFEPKAIDWNAKEMELSTGKIDVIWNGYTITKDRIGKVQFTKPYLENEQQIVVTSDSDIQTSADLADKVVGFQIDSAAEEVFNASDLAKSAKDTMIYDDFQAALLDLQSGGRVDAIICDKILIEYAMQQQPDTYKVLSEPLGTEYFGIGCRQDAGALADAIDKALDEMYEDGTVEDICAKWFDSNIVIRDVDRQTEADFE